METLQKRNYLNTKFSLDNLKKQKDEILKNPVTFVGFDKIGVHKDVMTKEYYDTPDFFLQSRGITVNKNSVKGEKMSELVVRFDTGRERIQFLSEIPDTFSMQIPQKASIYSYAEFIADSISALVPNGLNVNLFSLANTISKICTVKKSREMYKFISIQGLKINFTFSKAEFESNVSKKKELVNMLEITSQEYDKTQLYEDFVKKVSFNNPTIIRLKNSDILLAQEYLFQQ